MIAVCACGLNGVNPQENRPSLALVDVRELPPVVEDQAAALAGREGKRLLHRRRRGLSVALDFELHEPDPMLRLELCRELAAWANPGGWLTLSHRPGQRLSVTCDSPPTLTSALRWTETVTVTFTAHETPFWESIDVTEVSGNGRSGHVTLSPSGELPTVLEAQIKALGPLEALTLSVDGQSLRLTNLSMATGDKLVLDHAVLGLPRLFVGTRSVLGCRAPECPEDLVLRPYVTNSVTWDASNNVSIMISARGRYL